MMGRHSDDKLNGIYNAGAMEVSHAIILQRTLQCIRFPLIRNHAHLTLHSRLSDVVGELPK
jgi:hypothetical protein